MASEGDKRYEVIIAKTAGFCFGVKRAVDKVYEQIEHAGKTDLYLRSDHPTTKKWVKDFEEKV